MKPKPFRCSGCGKFLSYTKEVVYDYEPLSEYGPERIEAFHKGCK